MKCSIIAIFLVVAGVLPIASASGSAVWSRIAYSSGTIATGGVPQNIAETITNAQLRCVQNPTSATEDLFVAFGGTASATSGTDLAAGMQTCIHWSGAVSVWAATTGHSYLTSEYAY